MRKTAAVFISIGVILVITGLVIVGIFGGEALKNFSWSDIINGSSHDLTKANESKEITDIYSLSQISINVARYSVYVLPSDSDSVRVEYVTPLEGNANVSVNFTNGIISVTETDNLKRSWFGNGANRFIAVYLPQTEMFVNAELKIVANTASITIENVSLGALNSETQTGKIAVKDGKINAVTAKTKTGTVIINNVDSGTLSVETDTGSINITETKALLYADIEADTGSVNCNISTVKLTIETDTGSINFNTDATNIDLSADTGSINGTVKGYKTDYQITVEKGIGSSNISNQQVADAVRFLNVDVGTGSINIKFVND